MLAAAVVAVVTTASAVAAGQPSTASTTGSIPLTVLAPDGKPVDHATVVLVPAPDRLERYFVFEGDLDPWIADCYLQWRTDIAGRCPLPTPKGREWINAFSASGWVHVLRQEIGNDQIRLAPWATVEGVATRMGKPAAGWVVQALRAVDPEKIVGDPTLWARTAKVDASGHFRIDHVPPGSTSVSVLANCDGSPAADAGGAGWLYTQAVTLVPGETRELSLRRDGPAVEGAVLPPDGIDVGGLTAYAELDHRGSPLPIPYPAEIRDGTIQQRTEWRSRWEQTPAYAKWRQASKAALNEFANYPVRWMSPTNFRSDEVPPGTYDLDIRFYKPAEPKRSIAASQQIHFTVPAGASSNDKPIQLSPIPLHAVPPPAKVGQPAMDFMVPSLDGKPIRLSDYRGKVVLIDFWATWCGPCLAEIPNLTACYRDFAPTGRFTILSVSYDQAPANAKAYVDARHLTWDQAWIGEPIDGRIGEAYPGGLPTIVLIGADGKVIDTDCRGARMHAAVERAVRTSASDRSSAHRRT